jgi:hypothetical protein
MNYIKIFSIALMFTISKAQSQNGGLFLSADDFQKRAYSVEVGDGTISIGSSNAIVVKDENGKKKYPFESVVGYSYKGELFRAYGKKSTFGNYGYFKVEDQSGLIIYSHPVYVPKSGVVQAYYYSLSTFDPIKELNRKNLMQDFALNREMVAFLLETRNHKLHEKIRGKFAVNEAMARFHIRIADGVIKQSSDSL